VKTVRDEKMRHHKGCAACEKSKRWKDEKSCGMFCLSAFCSLCLIQLSY